VCRSKHVESSINFGLTNSIIRLHLVDYFYWFKVTDVPMDSRGLGARSFETSGPVFATVRRNFQENLHLQGRRCQNVPLHGTPDQLTGKPRHFCQSLVGKFMLKSQQNKPAVTNYSLWVFSMSQQCSCCLLILDVALCHWIDCAWKQSHQAQCIEQHRAKSRIRRLISFLRGITQCADKS
jgi:hypothetical protein